MRTLYNGPTAWHHVDRIGRLLIPADTEAHRIDAIKCLDGTIGRYDPELARREGGWGERVGQEYSYLGRERVEPVETFLDIGHNVGGATVWAARVWWPDTIAVVHAYDPNPACRFFYEANVQHVQRGVRVRQHCAAVSADPRPLFHNDARWGCSYTNADGLDLTAREADGSPYEVPGIHPAALPEAQAVKIDAENVEGEIVDHYPHWAGVLVLMLEWHSHANRRKAFALADAQGLRLMKNDCGDAQQGVACWVRP